MRTLFSSKRTWLAVLAAAVFSLVQATGRTQDKTGFSGRPSGSMGGDAAVRRLSAELKRLRSNGDLEAAALVFDRLFPPQTVPEPGAAPKLAAGFASGAGTPGIPPDKAVALPDGSFPVFVSPEIERAPSLDSGRGPDDAQTVLAAAEQWSGGRSRDIRILRSPDGGRTWPGAVVLGDGRPLTGPSLRRISSGAFGLAFAREWSGGDHDIHFARLTGDLAEAAWSPVALSRADQGRPALAADLRIDAAPYVYVVYGESEGRSGSVKLRASRDLGATWSRAVTIDEFAAPDGRPAETSLAFDPERGALHVAYKRPGGPAAGIAVASSTTFGASWSGPVFLTTPGDRAAASPAIAAGRGTVVVVHESGSGDGADIGLAYSTDSGRRWHRGPGLASTSAAETSPDVRAADGGLSPRFFASYVESGGLIRVLSCDAGAPQSWTTARTLPDEGTALSLGSARVLPMPAPDGGAAAGVLWTDRGADDDVYFSPAATVLALADLTVTPSNRDVPETAGETDFAVDKTGEGSVSWTAAVVAGGSWLAITSGSSGTDAGTIVAAYEANTGIVARTGSIQVTPAEAGTPSVTVTVTQAGEPAGALEVTPAGGLVASGPVGGPFAPSSQAYTLRNVGERTINWRAARIQPWTSLSTSSGNLNPGASRTVTVSINVLANGLAAGLYEDTVTFMNTTNGLGNTTRPVSLTISEPAGTLTVSPAGGLTSSGPVGGPFTPSSLDYTLRNAGPTPIDWSASKVRSWTSLSEASGGLAAGASTTVTVSINAGAESLPGGEYADTVSFVNTTNGNGSTTRPVGLTVNAPPGVLAVTPAAGLVSAGAEGGPFSPASQDYLLENTGGSAVGWTATKTQGWTTLSAAAGTLDPGQTTTLTVSINAAAEALAAGAYADTVTVTNTTNGTGTTARSVALTVAAGPVLSVGPADRAVPFTSGATTFDVANAGGGTLTWTAAVAGGAGWLSITAGASGTGPGTITVAFTANPSTAPRQAMIRVTAPGAAGSPRDVTVTQSGSTFGLTVSGERRMEQAWILRREYGRLSIAVDNPGGITVSAFAVYRRAGGQAEELRGQVPGTSVTASPWIYNDAFLEAGTTYAYRVLALDALGQVLGESNEITI
jgi:hypothetical protein